MRRFADTLQWADNRGFAIDAAVDERIGFLRRTYLHLAGEIGAVGLVSYLALHSEAGRQLATYLWSNFILYIAAFFGVALISRKLMEGRKSMAVQYAGAGLWVVFLGILVTPLAMIAHAKFGSYAILGQGFIRTMCAFVGITAYVFMSKKDFSFLGGALSMATWILVGIAFLSFFFGGFGGGSIWSILWVLLLCGWVLYNTSKVLHHRRVGEHVAASVDLLVGFVYLFIHIVLLLMNSRD